MIDIRGCRSVVLEKGLRGGEAVLFNRSEIYDTLRQTQEDCLDSD